MNTMTPAVPAQVAPASDAAPATFPCTISQRHHWLQDRAQPGDPTLNIAARWRLHGRVDAALLELALTVLIDRHEPLRTCFATVGGEPVQVVQPTAAIALRMIDLTGVAEPAREAAAATHARAEAAKPFDITRAPLLRASLVLLQADEADLLITTHHLVGDCWSNGILAQETADIYDALHAGRRPELAPLDQHFGDYARWQEEWLKAGGAAKALAYWDRLLADPPTMLVPADNAPPAQPEGRGEIVGMAIPPALVAAAQRTARNAGATVFMMGVAAFAALLHRWTGATVIGFGTQVAGREEVELEAVVGPFVNTVVLRLDLAGTPDFSALLDQVRQVVGEALEHAGAPIELVTRNRTQPVEAGRRDPLTALNFLVQRAFTRDAAHGDFALRGVPNFSPGSRYDLNLFLVERTNGWRVSCEYDPALFEPARIDWVLRAFMAVLDAASSNPAAALSTLPLATSPNPASASAMPEVRVAREALPPPDIEARLGVLWARVLRSKDVPPGANFFEMGGDSLRAARLLALTREKFGDTIGIGELFRAPTLRAMATHLHARLAQTQPAKDAVPNSVVTVQPHGTRPPIFAINNPGLFADLSRELGTDQPFFAVQALDPAAPPSQLPDDLREVASRYVAAIRAIRAHGPYVLIGLCVAGKIAFEVAQQLRFAGEEVRLLAVVDTWAPGHLRRLSGGRRLLAHANLRVSRCVRQLRRIASGTLSVGGFVANRGLVRRVRNSVLAGLRGVGVLADVPEGVQNNLFVDHLDAVARKYAPSRYGGRVLVFHGPEQPVGRFLDPSFGWAALVDEGPLAVIAVPADPHTRFENHHQGLFEGDGAATLARAIARAVD